MPTLAEETVAPDETAVIEAFIEFLRAASERRYPTGVVRRFNQARHAGCVDGELVVPDDLPPDLRVGLFARPGRHRAWIRFANASSASDRERDIRGMAIQVQDVEGDNLTPGVTTQDFVLNSHPVMMVPDAPAFLALLQALDAGGVRRLRYFLANPRSAFVALAARRHHSSHLEIPYWSATPYLFGHGRAVKYLVRPRQQASALPHPLSDTYLRDALVARLAQTDAEFDVMVQFQTDARRMPIEDATVEWRPRDSPFRPVARLRIGTQRLDDPARERRCEAQAFNPWHALPDHRPLGSLNRARRAIYAAMAGLRATRAATLTQTAADRTPT